MFVGVDAPVLAGPATRYTPQADSLSPTEKSAEIPFLLDPALANDRWPVPRTMTERADILGSSRSPLLRAEPIEIEPAALPAAPRPPRDFTWMVAILASSLLTAGAGTLAWLLMQRRRRRRLATALVRSILAQRLAGSGSLAPVASDRSG
jgi:hypothetical protein